MDLTLSQAAQLLGKSVRQVRYLIRTDRLPAHKDGGRWRVKSADLPLSPGRQRAGNARADDFRAVVDSALAVTPAQQRRRYSVADLPAFKLGRALHRAATGALGEEHASSVALRRALEELALGCHRYHRRDKGDCYHAARDHAAVAAMELAMSDHEAAPSLLERVEQDLLQAIAGLVRRMERRDS